MPRDFDNEARVLAEKIRAKVEELNELMLSAAAYNMRVVLKRHEYRNHAFEALITRGM